MARRRGLDLLRRESRWREKLALVAWPAESELCDRLRLILTCCHPALPRTAQAALTLRVVYGLPTAQIARAFLIPEHIAGQRITRAKREIRVAGIPDADELATRLAEVLAGSTCCSRWLGLGEVFTFGRELAGCRLRRVPPTR